MQPFDKLPISFSLFGSIQCENYEKLFGDPSCHRFKTPIPFAESIEIRKVHSQTAIIDFGALIKELIALTHLFFASYA
ncbi:MULTISPECIES: hypothetical protein [unclassified Spirosoma]|mgnify:FL=1|jgi:predicted membrane chloride channel (bestrophin family)|uniref:hypothetical protein n=1 Tax=unclassified Spirosoma TaxID=2621999 RepID=UPI000A922EAF|nr:MULTISPECIES: hypothetical protein [unclassified Spirosoma]MBN8820457.1 hypothetical protein [Spirosoma sp.]